MRTLKKSIELDLIIGFAFLLCTSSLWGQKTAVAAPDTFRQHFIKQVKPYLNGVSWVKDLVKLDTTPSQRNLMLKLLTHFDENWLQTAQYSKRVPDEWVSYWDAVGSELDYDFFPYYYFHDERICHVLGIMVRDSSALVWALENNDTTVIALTKLGLSRNQGTVFLNLQQLNTEYHYEPKAQTLVGIDQDSNFQLPKYIKGKFYNHHRDGKPMGNATAIINDSLVFAMNRWWQIQYKGKANINYYRGYRIWAIELKTRRPGYFLIKNEGRGGQRWALSLTIESSPTDSWQNYFQLGEKEFLDPLKPIRKTIQTIKLVFFALVSAAIAALVYHFVTRNQRRQQRQTQMSLAGLRAQLNPHFLFNTLTSIQDLMNQDNKPAANRYFNEMAQLLRYVVDSSTEEYTSLASELAALEKYCSLEALRTPFSYEFDLHPDLDLHNLEIPTMLLQPFVENAILHGLRPSQGAKHLKISLWPESGERVGISIIDDGIGIEESKSRQLSIETKRSHQGINTTMKRIDLINQSHKQKIMLKIEDRSQLKPNQTGTQVQLSIPI